MSLALTFNQALLETAGLGSKGLVGGSHGDNDQEREHQASRGVDSPRLKDDAQVLGVPIKEHVHAAGCATAMVSTSIMTSTSVMTSTSTSAPVSSVSTVVHGLCQSGLVIDALALYRECCLSSSGNNRQKRSGVWGKGDCAKVGFCGNKRKERGVPVRELKNVRPSLSVTASEMATEKNRTDGLATCITHFAHSPSPTTRSTLIISSAQLTFTPHIRDAQDRERSFQKDQQEHGCQACPRRYSTPSLS